MTITRFSAALFFRKKSAAENRVDAENIKIISGGQSPVNALGLRDAGERHVVIVIAEKSGKSLSALAEVTKVGIRKWRGGMIGAIAAHDGDKRSEEHTSELQSLRHLVCRL